jgi:hypothetical protein
MHSATVCSAEPSSAQLDVPVSETGGSKISRISDVASKTTMVDPDDWRTPLVRYLENPSHIANRKVRRQALKYVVLIILFIIELEMVYCLNVWAHTNLG